MSCDTTEAAWHHQGGIQGGAFTLLLTLTLSGTTKTLSACGRASAHSSSMVTLRICGAPDRTWVASSPPAEALRSLALMPSLRPMHTV